MTTQRISLGKKGEDITVSFLRDKGYRIVTRNYRQKSGEIDIICMDGYTYVFVEVKTRKTVQFGHPIEAVTRHKQHQISLTALNYLSRNNLLDEPVRFDVIGVIWARTGPEITHINGAFEAC